VFQVICYQEFFHRRPPRWHTVMPVRWITHTAITVTI
jgi:hypothetical protein